MPKQNKYSRNCGLSEERRRSFRYPIASAVSFQWKTPEGQWHTASGVTRNIGRAGVFVECESPPPLGSPLKLTVTLPTYSSMHGPVCLCGNGALRHLYRETSLTSGFGAQVEFQLELPAAIRHPH